MCSFQSNPSGQRNECSLWSGWVLYPSIVPWGTGRIDAIQTLKRSSQVMLEVRNPPANARDVRDSVRSLEQEDPLEEGTGNPLHILAWRVPWTEEPGRLQSIVSHKAGHDWSNLACRAHADS